MHIGPYRVLRVLARGGMGEVCLASLERAGGFRKLVALKRALPEFAADPTFSAMFQREARLAAALNHRNIVQVFDFAQHADEAWIAMEYVRGVDLKAVLDAERLPLGLAITIGLACARGLDYVHRAVDAQGQPLALVHQDVSPANVLLSYEGDIKLSDFGVAWQGDAAQRGLEGKLGYMSPEAVRGARLDARADQFALGVVLYEMLSGARAFWAPDGAEAILARVRSATPLRPLAEAAPDVAPALRAVVARAMAADPAARFADVAALAQALDAAAAEVDRSPRLGAWLAARFPEADAVDDAPVEVTVAAVDPIAVAEETAPPIRAIVAEPPEPPPPAAAPRRARLIWLPALGIAAITAIALWPDAAIAPLAPDAGPAADAQVVDAQVVDARVVDAQVMDARPPPDAIIDARPAPDAIIDASPPTAPPRQPRTRAPRARSPRTVASAAAPPTAAPTSVAPPTAPPSAAPATLEALRGPRVRARGAQITAARSLREGWHQVGARGAIVRTQGPGPAITLRVKPQAGRFVATITSAPFGPLRVDGRALGSTPAAAVPLAGGRHVIEVGVDPEITRLIIETGG